MSEQGPEWCELCHGYFVGGPRHLTHNESWLAVSTGCGDLRESFAAEMMRRGLATGHGDTLADLHREMWWQFDEIRNRQNEKGQP